MRPIKCLFGHYFDISGYLNADCFSWTDQRIGLYEQCSCGAWRFISPTATDAELQDALEMAKKKPGRPDPKRMLPRRKMKFPVHNSVA